MGTTKLNIGKIPISKGEYQEGTAYQRLNQVTMLGSTYQSKIDDNTSAPAQMGADGAVENINTDKWLCIAVGNVSAARKVVYNNETSGLEAGNVQEAIDEVGSKVSDLDNKLTWVSSRTDKISKEFIESEEDSISIEDNNDNEVFHLDENGLNAKDVKSNGKDVLTEHQDISGLATKSELENKQDKIENIKEEHTTNYAKCIDFYNDDYTKRIHYINEDGADFQNLSSGGARVLLEQKVQLVRNTLQSELNEGYYTDDDEFDTWDGKYKFNYLAPNRCIVNIPQALGDIYIRVYN